MKRNSWVLFLSPCCILFTMDASVVLAVNDESTQADVEKIVTALKDIKFESLMYLSYQDGEKSGEDYSRFALKRGYFTLKKTIFSIPRTPGSPSTPSSAAPWIKNFRRPSTATTRDGTAASPSAFTTGGVSCVGGKQ